MSEKFLIFDIYGDFAHFKRYYTTSSPLTFSIPPRTALIGLISAIIGIHKNEYLPLMSKDKAKLAVRILSPIKKFRMTQNLINTKGGIWTLIKKPGHEPRTQICFEYLKEPKFRIYFTHFDNEIYNSLKENLKEHKSYYTPYLGISELISNFDFINECSVISLTNENEFFNVNTVIPMKKLIEIDRRDFFQTGRKYSKELIPVEMLKDRVVTEYSEILFEIEGKPIKARIKDGLILENNDVIILL